jgi:NitT/TauT family transport system substrate-binding protein
LGVEVKRGIFLFLVPLILGTNVLCSKKEKAVLRIGYQPITDHLALMVAMEKGWLIEGLRKYGIEKIELKEFPTGPQEIHAMMGGEIDIAYVGSGPVIAGLYEGLQAKIIAGVHLQGYALVIKKELAREYKGASSLKGKKIATYPPGSVPHTVFVKFLMNNGVSLEELSLKTMGPSDAVLAMERGDVDGIFLPSPYPVILVEEGIGEIVETSHSIWKGHACCVIAVRNELINKHREMLVEIIKVHIRATEYIKTHTEEGVQIFSKWTNIKPSTIKLAFSLLDMEWIHNPELSIPSVLEYARVIYELNRERLKSRKHLEANEIFDVSIYKKAISEEF